MANTVQKVSLSQISTRGSSNGQVLASNGTAVYWMTGGTGYNGSVGFTGSAGVDGYTGSKGDIGYTGSSGIGFTGSTGQSGTSNTDAAIVWTNTHVFTSNVNSQNDVSGAVIIQGGLAVNNNISLGGRLAFSNSVSITVAYLVYNVSTNSIDTVFGS